MNAREALERWARRGAGDQQIDELAEQIARDPQLDAQAKVALRRWTTEWTGVNPPDGGGVNLAIDRGGREAFEHECSDGGFVIKGEDGKWYEITREYAEAMGLMAIGRVRDSRSKLGR